MAILLVDDHTLVRAGLKRLLAPLADGVFLEAGDGHDALALAKSQPLSMIFLDLNLPGLGGFELVRSMVATGAGPVFVLTMCSGPVYARRAIEAGASGFASKDISPEELIAAAQCVLEGGRFVEPPMADALTSDSVPTHRVADLSPRELEIMRGLSQGASLGEIARELGVSYKTAANTAGRMKSKLGVSRTSELVLLSIAMGVSPVAGPRGGRIA